MQISYSLKALPTVAILALSGLATSTSVSAQTAPPASPEFGFYGRLDVALESNDDGQLSRTALQNFSSRIGFKGERKFSDNLSGIFQVETGFAPDNTAQSKTLASRNSYVGLKNRSFGTLIMGTHDMPFKSLEGTANMLWGEGEAMEVIIHGKGSRAAVGSAVMDNLHTRKTNLVMYTSPKFSNIVAKLAYSPDEGKTATANKSMYGASIEFNNGMWNVGIATQSQDKFTATGGAMSGNKATAGLKLGDVTAGVAYSVLDNNSGKKTNNWMLSAAYKLGDVVLKASYGASSESSSGANDGLNMSAIEVDYSLDKAVTLYTYYAKINNNAKAKASFAAADDFPAVGRLGDSPSALGFGIRYNF